MGHKYEHKHTHANLKVSCFLSKLTFVYVLNTVSRWKSTLNLMPVRLCLHSYRAHSCEHTATDVTMLMMIIMMVFIYLQRWKKVGGGWMSTVWGAVERGSGARKSGGPLKRGTELRVWMVVCLGSHRNERPSCSLFICQSGSLFDWSYLCPPVMRFQTEIQHVPVQ